MSFQISNYDYILDGYSDIPFSMKEWKTYSIDIDNNDKCPVISAYNNIDYSDESISSGELSISISSDDKMSSDDIDSNNIIRSCDYFNSALVETDKNIKLDLKDSQNELFFEMQYNDIKISSYDLILFINKFGSKKLLKSFRQEKMEKYFNDTNIIDLYNPKKILPIIKNVQNALFENVPKEHKDIKLYDSKLLLKNLEKEKRGKSFLKKYVNVMQHKENEDNTTFIRWITPDSNSKYIVFGDYHGSFATFVRHLLRFKKLGIIDKKGKIKDNYKIIFLGDVIDRGIYSYEILIIIYILLLLNPNKIILNRGNHEDVNTNGIFIDTIYDNSHIPHKSYSANFINEMYHKFNDLDMMLEIYTEINNIMRLQSSGIICQDPQQHNKLIFMCHGCLPHDIENMNDLDSEFKKNLQKKKSFIVDQKTGLSIRWNDFHGKNNTIPSSRTISSNKYLRTIGKNVLNDAHNSGIVMVIRGHEDINHNTKIMEDDNGTWISIKHNKTTHISKKMGCYNENDKFGNMTHVLKITAKNKLIINDTETNYLPIITISTNTDIGKNLRSDSYVIISFNENDLLPHCT